MERDVLDLIKRLLSAAYTALIEASEISEEEQDPTVERVLMRSQDQAWRALARGDFFLFGHYAAIFRTLSAVMLDHPDDPFRPLIDLAREHTFYGARADARDSHESVTVTTRCAND